MSAAYLLAFGAAVAAVGIIVFLPGMEDSWRQLPRRLRVYLEPRDCWVGVYVSNSAVYVCLLPFVVIRWSRCS